MSWSNPKLENMKPEMKKQYDSLTDIQKAAINDPMICMTGACGSGLLEDVKNGQETLYPYPVRLGGKPTVAFCLRETVPGSDKIKLRPAFLVVTPELDIANYDGSSLQSETLKCDA